MYKKLSFLVCILIRALGNLGDLVGVLVGDRVNNLDGNLVGDLVGDLLCVLLGLSANCLLR